MPAKIAAEQKAAQSHQLLPLQTRLFRLQSSDARSMDPNMKKYRCRSIARSRERDLNPERELPSLKRPGLPDTDHEPTTRKARLRRATADRLAIERGENEGMIDRAS